MTEIKRCNRCILPDTIPGISFDEAGNCNYCVSYERNFANWKDIAIRKKEEFETLLDKAKKLNRPYDCLVPLSGGKDTAHLLFIYVPKSTI